MSKQSALSGALFATIAQATVLILGYGTHLWVGSILGTESYGIYGIVLSLQTIVGLVLSLGIPAALSHFVAQDEEHAQSLLKQSLRLQVILGVIVSGSTLILSWPFARLLGDRSLTPFIQFMGLMLFLQAGYPIFVQYVSGLHLFSKQSILTIIYAVAKLAGAIILLYIFGLYGAFAGFGVGALLATIIGWYWVGKQGGSKQKTLPLKKFLSFAGAYALILIGLQILISLDLFMVKALLKDNTLAGYYNAAITLSRIPYFLLQGLSFVLLPSVSALTKPGKSHDEAAGFIRDVLRYLIMIIVPGVAIGATTSKDLLHLFFFFSDKYLPAAPILSILIIGLGSLAFYLLLINIVAGAGRAKVGLSLTVVLLAVSAILGFILIPQYGLIGAALQTTITAVIGLFILAWYTFRTFHIPVPVRSTINILVASGVAILPTYLWKPSPLLLPVYYCVLGALYLLTLWILREITTADTDRIRKFLPKK